MCPLHHRLNSADVAPSVVRVQNGHQLVRPDEGKASLNCALQYTST